MAENTIITNADTRDPESVLPDLCDAKNVFLSVLLTMVLAIIFALASSHSNQTFWDYLSMAAFLMLWICLLNVALLCSLGKYLRRLDIRRCLTGSFLLMMAVSTTVALAVMLASDFIDSAFSSDIQLDRLFLFRVVAISAVIYFILLRYLYIQHQWRQNMVAQSQARLQSLQARIRPHFLFNSMNTIASLIEDAPEKAEQAVEDLSDLFRASLGDHDLNSLSDEVALTRSYLGIEALRLGERLQVEWRIDDDALSGMLPALTLQPLVENAIYHGIEPLPKGGKILISLLKVEDKLELSVSNPLAAENATRSRKGNQIAQENIRQRLNLVYGSSACFSINDTKENYTVTLIIPFGVSDERANRR